MGGTGVSTIVPGVTNDGKIEVTSGTLDFGGGNLRTGADTISGASTLELDAEGLGWPNSSLSQEAAANSHCINRGEFAGDISGFDTAGAGSNDTIEVAKHWVFTGFKENAGGTQGTLGFKDVSISSVISLTLARRLQPRRLRASNPSERKHADNLQRRLWVGYFVALRRDALRRIGHRPRGNRERARRPGLRRELQTRSVTDLDLRRSPEGTLIT